MTGSKNYILNYTAKDRLKPLQTIYTDRFVQSMRHENYSKGIGYSINDFILECLEINPVMIERGKEIAKEIKAYLDVLG